MNSCTITALYIVGKDFIPDSDAEIKHAYPVKLTLNKDGLCIQRVITLRDFSELTNDSAEDLIYDSLFFEFNQIQELKTRKLFREPFISFRYEGRQYFLQYLSDVDGGTKKDVKPFLRDLTLLTEKKKDKL